MVNYTAKVSPQIQEENFHDVRILGILIPIRHLASICTWAIVNKPEPEPEPKPGPDPSLYVVTYAINEVKLINN